MNKKSIYLAMALLSLSLITLCCVARASQVSFQTLEELIQKGFITQDTLIAAARVTSIEKSQTEIAINMEYAVDAVEVIQGAPAFKITSMVYSQVIPVKRDENGTVIMSFSPILPGSGIEFSLKEGETYIFFSNFVSPLGAMMVFRVEPIEKKKEILKQLGNKQ